MIANGETETIDMRGKRSWKIYEEIMGQLRAVDVRNEQNEVVKEKAETIARPYLKWM